MPSPAGEDPVSTRYVASIGNFCGYTQISHDSFRSLPNMQAAKGIKINNDSA